jgi:predicted nucleic acid-binding protein
MKIFIESDVILDLLLKRQLFHFEAEKIFDLAAKKKIKLYTTPIVISNVYYIINDINKKKNSKLLISKIRKIVEILPMDSYEIDNAVSSEINDFEDALQYYSCIKNNMDHIISRNIKDYKKSKIPVSDPKEFLIIVNVNI